MPQLHTPRVYVGVRSTRFAVVVWGFLCWFGSGAIGLAPLVVPNEARAAIRGHRSRQRRREQPCEVSEVVLLSFASLCRGKWAHCRAPWGCHTPFSDKVEWPSVDALPTTPDGRAECWEVQIRGPPCRMWASDHATRVPDFNPGLCVHLVTSDSLCQAGRRASRQTHTRQRRGVGAPGGGSWKYHRWLISMHFKVHI